MRHIAINLALGLLLPFSLGAQTQLELSTQMKGTLSLLNGGTASTTGSITGSGALTLAAGGSNQNVTLTPSGSGFTVLNGNVGLGVTTPSCKFCINGDAGRIIGLERNTAGVSGSGMTVQSGGAKVGETDKLGGTLVLSGGLSTGTGTSNIDFYTAAASGSGSGDNSPALKMRLYGNGTLKLNASSYLNWGSTSGDSGYGLFDNAGTLQLKKSGGAWVDIPGSGACTNQAVTALIAGAGPTCTTLTSAYVDSTILTTSTTATGISGPTFCADAGANDTYTCNLSPAIASYVTGTRYRFKANTINTGAASINFNAKGALTIKKQTAGSLTTDLADNDIRAGQWVEVVYDGTNAMLVSPTNNVKPVAEGGTGTSSTLTGLVRGSATAMTAAELSGDVTTAGSNATTLISKFRTRVLHFKLWGTGASNVLQDADDEATIWRNEISAATITKVVCECDTGNPTIQLQKDDGSAANMFASALTCDATPSGTNGSDGILTSFQAGEASVAATDRIDYLTVSAGGTAHWVAVTVTYTID